MRSGFQLEPDKNTSFRAVWHTEGKFEQEPERFTHLVAIEPTACRVPSFLKSMMRVVLPYHLRNLAHVDNEVTLGAVTQGSVLDALEARYPMPRRGHP